MIQSNAMKKTGIKKAGIRMLGFLYGFFLISSFYCGVYIIIGHGEKEAFVRSLLFLPIIMICSLSVEKGIQFFWYVLISAAMGTAAFEIVRIRTASLRDSIILLLFVIVILLAFFFGKATGKECWLDSPHIYGIAYYVLACFFAAYYESDFVVRYCSLAAGFHYLTVNVYKNQQEKGLLLREYKKMERLPVNRINRYNERMMWIQTGIVAAMMAVAPYLKLDQLLMETARMLRRGLIWLVSLLGSHGAEEAAEQINWQQMQDLDLSDLAQEESWLMKIIDRIMEVLGWIVLIGFLILLIRFYIKKMMELYSRFNARTEENGDIVENLMAGGRMEEKIRQEKEKREHLWFRFSTDARIRRLYKKRIEKVYRQEIPRAYTPEQLEEQLVIEGEKKEKLHVMYEKARYAQENCSREELQQMTEL